VAAEHRAGRLPGLRLGLSDAQIVGAARVATAVHGDDRVGPATTEASSPRSVPSGDDATLQAGGRWFEPNRAHQGNPVAFMISNLACTSPLTSVGLTSANHPSCPERPAWLHVAGGVDLGSQLHVRVPRDRLDGMGRYPGSISTLTTVCRSATYAIRASSCAESTTARPMTVCRTVADGALACRRSVTR
jgi:hypothetical protein